MKYVYVCAGCDRIDVSDRRHRTTCSDACRVKAHRNGRLKSLHAIAETMEIPTASILQCDAVDRLRPDLGTKIGQGQITLAEAMPEACNAFWKLLQKLVSAT